MKNYFVFLAFIFFNVIAVSAGLTGPGVTDTKVAEAVPAVDHASSNTNNAIEKPSAETTITKDKEVIIVDKKIEVLSRENFHFNAMETQLLIWSLAGVVLFLLLITIVGYIFLRQKNTANLLLISQLEREIDIQKNSISELNQHLKNAENKLPLNPSKPFLSHNKDVINTSVESVELAQIKPEVDQMTKIVPYPQTAIPESEIQEVPPTVNAESLYNEILQAITSLANSRSNLTEANFIFKLASVVSNPLIKASIIEKMESVHFFRSSGSPSPQGPELIAYGLKENSDYHVVPYPSAGRVGLFRRWFDNAGKNYEVNPVLAIRPALGSIGSDGNLVLVAQGTLA
jgi:hypothetical protein